MTMTQNEIRNRVTATASYQSGGQGTRTLNRLHGT